MRLEFKLAHCPSAGRNARMIHWASSADAQRIFLPCRLRRFGGTLKVSVLIPVYNEFRAFDQVLERVRRAALPESCVKEIVVVDDGSTDGTAGRVRDYDQR